MVGERQTLVFTREGVRVEEERQAPLSDDTKTVLIDELDWDEFPINDLTMEVNSITPVPSDDDENALQELRFQVGRLVRSTTQNGPLTGDRFWQEVKEQTGITKEDDTITLSSDKNAKGNLQAFVEFLLTNGYLTEDDLPVKSGWKRYLINAEPVDQEGESMVADVEVVDGVFLETKYSRDNIRKKIRELGEEFGE